MAEEYDPWDYITKDDVEVMNAINKLKKTHPEETKIVTDYMGKLVKLIKKAESQ